MSTRRKVQTVSRGMLDAEGHTKAEARANLETRVDAALSGSYEPFIVTYRGQSALCYRDPTGWRYALLDPGRTRADGFIGPGCTQWFPSCRECEQSAAFHIIQLGMDVDAIRADADLPPWLECPRSRATLISCAQWQRAARFAMNHLPDGIAVADSNAIHRWACNHARDEQFA